MGRAKKTSALLTARIHDRTAHHSRALRDPDKKKPGHPRGAGSARAVGRTGQRAGRPGPDGVESATPGRLSTVLALVAGAASNGQPAAARAGGRVGGGIEASGGGGFGGPGG